MLSLRINERCSKGMDSSICFKFAVILKYVKLPCINSNRVHAILVRIFFPCTMLPSYFHLQLSYFQNFSSIIFHFHISYILHFPSSWSFFRFFFFFPNVLSFGFPTLLLPISFQLSSLSVSQPIFLIRGQLFHSISIFQFPFFLSIVSEFPHRPSILGITLKM